MSCHDRYAQTNRKRLTVLAVGTVALVFFVLLDLAVGSSNLSVFDACSALLHGPGQSHIHGVIIWDLRLPMTLTALFVGMALAVAGLQIQNITGDRKSVV